MIGPTTIGAIEVVQASFFSTHHGSASDVLAGRERPFVAPAFELLAGRARRFTSLATQMHVEVCGALQPSIAEPRPAVFATCHGEIQTAGMLIADFHQSALVSSARFALSVHNTASGVYSVATSSNAPTTTVTGANAIAAGWLEAALTAIDLGVSVLLSIADEPVPAMFQGPAGTIGVAAGFLLRPASPTARGVELAITPAIDDVEIDPLRTLARVADAWLRAAPATIALGRIQPGMTLELRIAAEQGSRA